MVMTSIIVWSLIWNGIKIFYINKPYADWPLEEDKNFSLVAKGDGKYYGHERNEVLRDAFCSVHYNNTVQLLSLSHWLLDGFRADATGQQFIPHLTRLDVLIR